MHYVQGLIIKSCLGKAKLGTVSVATQFFSSSSVKMSSELSKLCYYRRQSLIVACYSVELLSTIL